EAEGQRPQRRDGADELEPRAEEVARQVVRVAHLFGLLHGTQGAGGGHRLRRILRGLRLRVAHGWARASARSARVSLRRVKSGNTTSVRNTLRSTPADRIISTRCA